MQKIYQTAIIGGGAAGLMTAVELCRGDFSLNAKDVIILERLDRVGKKLIATGNGQGNLTNDDLRKEFYYGDEHFITAFLQNEKNINLKKYLENLGIPLISKDKKVYPLSKQASSVLDVLRAHLKNYGCDEVTSSEVLEIKKQGGLFLIKTQSQDYLAKTVVMATGGCVAKQFGTDGKAYKLVEKMGHKLSPVYPSLVQLKTELPPIKGLKGLKEIAKVTAIIDEKPFKSAVGDLLFTEFGVSGSAIFQISSAVVDKEGVVLNIEFAPETDSDRLTEILKERKQKYPYLWGVDSLNGILNKRIGQAVIKTAKSDSPDDICYATKNFNLKVTGNLGANYAQVTKGGILTKDVDPFTMESKLANGMYLVGEILDVDGDCGGYNLTFAFVSGIVCAKSIKEKFSNLR